MTIEATLQEISSKLSTLITLAQPAAQSLTPCGKTACASEAAPLVVAEDPAPVAAADAPAAAEPAKRVRRTKAQIEADNAAAAAAATTSTAAADVAEGDPEGTTYFVSEDHQVTVAVLPGEAPPAGNGFAQVPAALYLSKKAEFEPEGNAPAATTTQVSADSAPTATQEPEPALAATSGAEPSWDDTVAELLKVAKHPKLGNVAVKKIMSAIDPKATVVPALKPLNKNAQIVALAATALSSVEVDDAALFG